jgi:arsenate reductase (thioredoxin)
MAKPIKVLFVCAHNSCRSQMAEALARALAPDVIAPASAGITPIGYIAHQVQFVLLQRGILMDGQFCKSMRHPSIETPQLYINLSGIPGQQLFAGLPFEDWDVPDPADEKIESFQPTCEDIESRVLDLADRVRTIQPED